MTITRDQVADLQPGDVVELTDDLWRGTVMRGPLVVSDSGIGLAIGYRSLSYPDSQVLVRRADGAPSRHAHRRTLTVISRAPRPPYVNHDRAKPAAGDVARDEDGDVWLRDRYGKWVSVDSETDDDRLLNWRTGPRPTLLVDGETGQVVQ